MSEIAWKQVLTLEKAGTIDDIVFLIGLALALVLHFFSPSQPSISLNLFLSRLKKKLYVKNKKKVFRKYYILNT